MTEIDDSTSLELRVFGGVEVWLGGKRLELALRLRWLLCRIALERAPIGRARLAQTFWSKGSTQSLRQALYTLRALDGAAQWLSVQRDAVSVRARCDALEFDERCAEGRFEDALALAPAALFGDVAFEHVSELALWVDEQRARFEQRWRQCLLGAARACIARGSFEAALEHVDKGLALDPLDESLAREGMRACAAMGAVRAALDRYEVLRRGLLATLGVEPTVETDALADELSALGRAPRVVAAPTLVPGTLFGRDDEFSLARSAIARRVPVLLDGALGTGKSSLLAALLPSLGASWTLSPRHREASSAFSSARRWLIEAGAPLSLGPSIDAATVVRAPLGLARVRWAVSAALARARGDRPLVLDDLHECDSHSALALLDALREGDAPVVIVVRDEALDASVRDELYAFERERGAARVVLGPLSADAVRAMVRARMGAGDEDTTRVVIARSGAVARMVCWAIDDALDGSTSPSRALSANRWVSAALDALSLDARRLAQWRSVDDGSDDALAGVVLGLDAGPREAAVRELERAGLVNRGGFLSSLVRAAARATVSASVARGWHRGAAEELERRGESEAAAWHWSQCGEDARAARGWIAAAQRSAALFALDEAERLLSLADAHARTASERFAIAAARESIAAARGDLVERERSIAAMREWASVLQRDRALIEARLRAVALLRERAQYVAVSAECAELAADCARAGAEDLRLRTQSEAAVALLRTGEIALARVAFEALAQSEDASAVAVGQYGLGAVHGYRLELDEARAMHERVLTAARARGDLGMVVRALNGLAATAERAGQRLRAADRFVEAAAVARAIHDREGRRMAEVNAALAWVFGGKLGRAFVLLEARRDGDESLMRPRALEAQARAELSLEAGDFAGARAEFDRCESIAIESGDQRRAAHARLERAFASPSWEQCLACAERELSRTALTGDVSSLSWLELALVAPSEALVRAMIERAGTPSGTVASLLSSLALLRLGEDRGASLDRALSETETMFVLLGYKLVAARRSGAARAEAEARFAAAFAAASEGLSPELTRAWGEWLDVRASAALDAPWTWQGRSR
jgi:DNA-binding SARP family transcriptional activator